jgi:PAS domain S-box-containing protein
MRALLAVHDSAVREPLERALARRGWSPLPVRLADVVAAYREEPVPLLCVQADTADRTAAVLRAIRDLSVEAGPYLLAIASGREDHAIRTLIEAGADDLLGPLDDVGEIDTRLAVMEARMACPLQGLGRVHPSGAGQLDEMQRKLHVQQAFLEGLFESAPEGVVILDAEDRVVRINSEFTRVFGYAPEEALGRPLNDLIVPDELRTEGVALDGGVRRGERVMVETVRRHKDGHLIDVSVLATPIEANGPVGAFGIYRDITEKKRQEAALRASEARYRALFDQSPVGVFLCDRDLRITHCNEYLTAVIGAPYERIVGADLLSLRNSRLLPGLRAALGGEPAFYEGPYRAQNGKQLHVSVQYAPLRNDRGEVIGGIGVLDDISDRVTAEKQLRAQATEMERVNTALRERTLELEAAMKARSRLYSGMNHELRTPISAILLYQELLLAGSLGRLGDEQLRALEHSHTATRHLLDLVRDILDLSKLEAGRVSVQPVEVCLKELLTGLRASLAPLTERHGSPLLLDLHPRVGSALTDPQRVRQILTNFVSNAAKYGRRNPIVIRCLEHADGEVRIEVVDRGIGIAKDDLEQIFEDFVQLGTEMDEGTGLGLGISRRLAGLLGGRVEVESELGAGSTFRLVLPARSHAGTPARALVGPG